MELFTCKKYDFLIENNFPSRSISLETFKWIDSKEQSSRHKATVSVGTPANFLHEFTFLKFWDKL